MLGLIISSVAAQSSTTVSSSAVSLPTGAANCPVYQQCQIDNENTWNGPQGYCKLPPATTNATIAAQCTCYYLANYYKCFAQCTTDPTIVSQGTQVGQSAQSACSAVGFNYLALGPLPWGAKPATTTVGSATATQIASSPSATSKSNSGLQLAPMIGYAIMAIAF